MGTAVPAKICVRCGEDCSDRPRVKDALGHYYCQPCAERVRAERNAPTPAAAPVPRPDDGPIPLADDAPPATADAAPRECVGCGLILSRDAVICTRCGLNTRTGLRAGADGPTGAGRACVKCGYDLAGLKSPRCPECGTLNSPRARRRARDDRDARAVERTEYTKPLIMFAAGLAISSAITAGVGDGVQAILWYLIGYALYVPAGTGAFFVCCLLWIGFDAPMHLTALRLAAVYAVTDAVAGVMGFVPLPIIPMLVVLFTYIGLLMDLLDLDVQDAVIVAVATSLIQAGVVVVVTMYRMDLW